AHRFKMADAPFRQRRGFVSSHIMQIIGTIDPADAKKTPAAARAWMERRTVKAPRRVVRWSPSVPGVLGHWVERRRHYKPRAPLFQRCQIKQGRRNEATPLLAPLR